MGLEAYPWGSVFSRVLGAVLIWGSGTWPPLLKSPNQAHSLQQSLRQAARSRELFDDETNGLWSIYDNNQWRQKQRGTEFFNRLSWWFTNAFSKDKNILWKAPKNLQSLSSKASSFRNTFINILFMQIRLKKSESLFDFAVLPMQLLYNKVVLIINYETDKQT